MRRRGWIAGLTIGVAVAGVAQAAVPDAIEPPGVTGSARAERLVAPPRSLSVVAAGDWLPESRVNAAAAAAAPPGVRFDHVPLLAPIAPMIASADLAICHMETPIGWPGAPVGLVGRAAIGGYSLIAAPFEVADDLRRVGFDRCSTASNHSWDLGASGVESTLVALELAGLGHVGTARSPAEAAVRTTPFDVHGVRVAHLSYARNSNVGFPRDAWRIDRAVDAGTIVADVAEARARGAELVIVSLHVFVEMTSAPVRDDRALVTAVTGGADVDLVVVHGPHTIHPLEVVDGTPVFWSLGNLVSGMGVPGRGRFSDPRTLDGLLAAVRFTERPGGGFDAEAAPVLLCQMTGSRVVHAGLAAAVAPDEVDDIEACVARSAPVVADLR